MRKNFNYITFFTTFLLFSSHVFSQPIPANIKGQAVATCFAGFVGNNNNNPIQDAYVVGVMDVHTPVGPGANWTPPMYHGPANSWKSSRLGQIYGIAIDMRNNIFVTATQIYNHPATDPYANGSAGTAGIYKLDGVTGMVSDLVTTVSYNSPITPGTSTALPNGDGASIGPGLGNICYSRTHDKLFVTNFEDGKIYSIDPITGVIDGIYDPIVAANPGSTANPAMIADALVNGIVPKGDRVWGVAFNSSENRVYYSVWMEDFGSGSPATYNIIRSVALDATGQFLPATDIFEIALSDNASGRSNPVADIAFNSQNNLMIVGERSMWNMSSSAHSSRAFSYSGSSGNWTTPNQFFIGIGSNKNCAGGVDFGYGGWDVTTRENIFCDSVAWFSSDYMWNAPGFGMMYGVQRTPVTGNTSGTVGTTGYFIDLNGIGGTQDKTQIGDVEIFRDSCGTVTNPGGGNDNPCKTVQVNAKPWQSADGACCWQLGINNSEANFWTQVTAQLLTTNVTFTGVTGGSGWGVTNTGTFATYNPPGGFLPTGTIDSLIFCLFSLVPPPQEIEISFVAKDGTVCKDTIRVDCAEMAPPVPSCAEIVEQTVECSQFGATGALFNWSFAITNNSPFSNAPYNYPAENILVYPVTAGVTVTPGSATFPPLGYGQTSAQQPFTISGPGAVSGATICIAVQLHGNQLNDDYQWCCPPDTICIVLPECEDCCNDFQSEIIQEKLTQNGSGISNLVSTITVAPNPVIKVTATIISAYRKNLCAINPQWQPVFGYIQNAPANIAGLPLEPNPVPFGSPPPSLFAEANWGTVPAGVNFSGVNMNLDLKFPAPPGGFNCADSLRFCVRYSFTDTLCVTCDTIICYEQKRKGKIIIANPWPVKPAHLVKLKMTGMNSGELIVDLPAAEPDDDYIVSKLTFAPPFGVKIISLSGINGSDAKIVEGEKAVLRTKILPGTKTIYNIEFNNYTKQNVFTNSVTLDYLQLPSRELMATTAEIEARVPVEGEMTDILATDENTDRMDVQTFQIYFANMNFTKDSISKLRISLSDDDIKNGVEIVAFGPPETGTEIIAGAFGNGPDNGSISLNPLVSGLPTNIAPGGEVRPIYITVSGLQDSSLILMFQAVNSGGNVVTQAEAKVGNPLYTGTTREGENPIYGFGEVNGLELFQNYPNPTNGVSTIQFYSTNNLKNVSLVVSDLNGKIVTRLIEKLNITSGNHSVLFDTNRLPAGTYYYSLVTPKGKITKSMNIVK